MKNRFYKITRISIGSISFIVSLIIFFSPFSYDKNPNGLIETSVTIESDCEHVFNYLGNSDNASTWSVYVDKIIPLNADEVQDGFPGSKRRCLTTGNKNDFRWDEEILSVEKNKSRTLSCFNYKNLMIDASNLITEQKYNPTTNGCEVTFTLRYETQDVSFVDYFKMKVFGYYINYIFEENLENIKIENEKANRKYSECI